MNFGSSLACVISLYAQNIIPPRAFFLLYICAFSLTLYKSNKKCFQSFFLKYTRKLWNEGCLLSALHYIAHVHLRVPHRYLGVQCSYCTNPPCCPITTTNCPKLLTY